MLGTVLLSIHGNKPFHKLNEEIPMSNESIIIDGIKAGNSKAAVLTALIRNDEKLDLGKAAELFKKVGTDEGLLLDNDTKDKLTVEIATANLDDERVFNREAATAQLVEKAALTKSAASNRLKAWCEDNDVTFPAAVRVGRDMQAVHESYTKWTEDGIDRDGIEAGLVEHFGYTENNVGSAFNKIGKELGFISSGRSDLAAWFADAENVVGDKAAITAKLMVDTGIAQATADVRYGMYLFALEFVKEVSPEIQEAA